MLMRHGLVIILAITGFWIGSSLIRPVAGVRTPAAVPNLSDTGPKDISTLKDQIVRDVLNATTTERRAEGIALRFGGTVEMASENGRCDQFERMVITLIGEGVATSGEPTQMRIEAPCQNMVLIPFGKIYGLMPTNGSLNIEDETLQISVANIADDWPPEWYVGSVSFVDATDETDQVTIEATDFRKAKGRAVALYW